MARRNANEQVPSNKTPHLPQTVVRFENNCLLFAGWH